MKKMFNTIAITGFEPGSPGVVTTAVHTVKQKLAQISQKSNIQTFSKRTV